MLGGRGRDHKLLFVCVEKGREIMDKFGKTDCNEVRTWEGRKRRRKIGMYLCIVRYVHTGKERTKKKIQIKKKI